MSQQYVDPRYVAQHYVDPRYVDPRYVDPRYVDPRYVRTPQTNVPGPSGYSPTDLSMSKSGLSNAPADDSSSVTYLGFCILAMMFILLTGAVTYAFLGSAGAGGDDSATGDDSFGSFGGGGGSGGGGGFPSGDNGPIMDKEGELLLLPYGIHGGDGGTPGGAEEKPVKEYICTVGAYAVLEKMYPEDGLCDYLYYTEVGVFNHKVAFTEVEMSWTLFQQQAKALQKTGAGISFDARYVKANQLKHKSVKAQLQALAANNIKHYGLLKMKGRDAELKRMFDNSVLVMEDLKNIQSSDSLRLIIAFGIMEHDMTASLELLNSLIKRSLQQTKADTVIVISSSNLMDHDQNCAAIPPLLRTTPVSHRPSPNTKFPSLKTALRFLRDNFPLVNKTRTIGLTMEMAVKTYVLKYSAPHTEFIPFTPCVSAGFASANIICSDSAKKPSRVLNSGLAGFVTAKDNKTVFFAESFDTIVQKVKFVEMYKIQKRFAWLLYNVHFTDIEGRCNETAHARISHLKKLF